MNQRESGEQGRKEERRGEARRGEARDERLNGKKPSWYRVAT
jgi:hypothetical protein